MSILRIALFVSHWGAVTQRPHHWEMQATRAGHQVDIITLHESLLKSLFRRSKFPDMPNMQYIGKGIGETILLRMGRLDTAQAIRQRNIARFLETNLLPQLGERYDAVLYASPPCDFVKFPLHKGVFVYDCMDDWQDFPNTLPRQGEWEQSLATQADLVLAVSPPLVDKMQQYTSGEKVLLVPNGCDSEFFASAMMQHDGARQRLVIGYAGSIEDWFDWDSVLALAAHYSNAEIRVIGPVRSHPGQVPPNVTLPGRQPYATMPAYYADFDVCIIPFRLDKAYISSVSPIKLYEYLAAGKPVVSAAMPDVVQLAQSGVVHVANTPEEFIVEVAKAAAVSSDPELIAKRQLIARENSWKQRWQQIEQRIVQVLETKSSR